MKRRQQVLSNLPVSLSLSGSVAMVGACPPAAGGKVPPGRPRRADVTMVPGIWQELSASSGYGWSRTEPQLQHQSKQAAQCHNTRAEWGLEPLSLLFSGFVSWALWTGAIERHPGQQHSLSQSITAPQGELEVHSHRGRIAERAARGSQRLKKK